MPNVQNSKNSSNSVVANDAMIDYSKLRKEEGSVVSLENWGYPGYLTEDEFNVFKKFRTEIYSRDQDLRDTVFSFQRAQEREEYAICRWLRARKYNLENAIQMVEEATQCTAPARKHDFYPSPTVALGVESSFYVKAYPQVYYGHAKNGCPVFYSKPGVLDIHTIECLTSFLGLINFHWNAMMHDFVKKLHGQYKLSNGEFKRYECVCILDLSNLTSAQLAKKPMKIIKEQSTIDSLCFPETLNKMVIVNAPGFFTFTWKILRTWVDQRTANKVSVLGTSRTKMISHLTDIIEKKHIPSEFGGDGKTINELLEEVMVTQYEDASSQTLLSTKNTDQTQLAIHKQDTVLMSIRGQSSECITVKEGRLVKLSLFTKSVIGGNLSILDQNDMPISTVPKNGIQIRHEGLSESDDNDKPTRNDLDNSHDIILEGPGTYKVVITSNTSKSKTVYIVLGITECMKQINKFVKSDSIMKEKPQAGQESLSVLISSSSICSGSFGFENSGDIIVKPTPRSRKDKKVFRSTTAGIVTKNIYDGKGYKPSSSSKMKSNKKDAFYLVRDSSISTVSGSDSDEPCCGFLSSSGCM
mmetsp:Transcript_15088/g.18397  ORF Transcript_15088/g.18397 Transcript_15088/m.18397 type:complete len:583 (+) Transcript_15088:158-1906(+)